MSFHHHSLVQTRSQSAKLEWCQSHISDKKNERKLNEEEIKKVEVVSCNNNVIGFLLFSFSRNIKSGPLIQKSYTKMHTYAVLESCQNAKCSLKLDIGPKNNR